MGDAGIDDPETMHYGEEKSRNDFAAETVGLVNGSIDPGDDYVVDLLAEHGLDATPETTTDEDGEQRRAHGRGFVGEDAATARSILASVRENHVAQAAGRYARDAYTDEERAVVFVRTDATPPGFVDLQTLGVEWTATDTQRDIVKALRERRGATAKELAEETGASKRHVAQTLERLVDHGTVDCRERAGDHGAHIYRALTGAETPSIVDVGGEDIAAWTTNEDVWNSYTWSFVVSPPPAAVDTDSPEVSDIVSENTVPPDENQTGLESFRD